MKNMLSLCTMLLAVQYLIGQNAPTPIPQAPANILVTEEPVVASKDLDQTAKYEGGSEALASFISENMKYPLDSKGRKITGTTYLEFILEKDGTISRAKITTGSGSPELDAEALRLTKLIHFKTAAMKDGKPVRSKYVMPIEFKSE